MAVRRQFNSGTPEGGALKLFIELRDVGYPGSTYTLTYLPAGDRLTGVYYQAAIQPEIRNSLSKSQVARRWANGVAEMAQQVDNKRGVHSGLWY